MKRRRGNRWSMHPHLYRWAMQDFSWSLADMAMRWSGGNRRKAAKLLGISVSSLGRILRSGAGPHATDR